MEAMDRASAPGVYRSRFGGLWVDRSDAMEVLSRKQRVGEVNEADTAPLRHYIEHGYAVFPRAVSASLADEYLEFFEDAWDAPPAGIYAHSGGEVVPLSRSLYDRVAKVSDLHYYFPHAARIIFPAPVLRFLSQIYERPPVVFQSMTMRKGSEESLHIDTGPLTLTEPMGLAASWVALEDVKRGSGEFQFVPRSHALPEILNNGVSKGHGGDMNAYHKVLTSTMAECDARGLRTEHFMANKGDVLVWHADLMHGGAKIANPRLTRKSLICHYTPLGAMPTFYDFSKVNCLPYREGGWYLDRIKPEAMWQPRERSFLQHVMDRASGAP